MSTGASLPTKHLLGEDGGDEYLLSLSPPSHISAVLSADKCAAEGSTMAATATRCS